MAKRLGGLYLDCDPIDQPQNTYRDAQNAILTRDIGAIMSDFSIPSEDVSAVLGTDPVVLGHIVVNDDRIVLFTVNQDDTNSQISIYDGDSLTSVLQDNNLSFSSTSEIDTTFRINRDSEAVVYFTDDVNPPRRINVDSVQTYTDINEFNIFPHVSTVATIDIDAVNDSGGGLNTGVYFFAISYKDEDGNQTDHVAFSGPVYVNDDPKSNAKDDIDGAPGGTPTSKSISLTLNNLDTSYTDVSVAVISKEDGVFTTPRILSDKNISSSSISFNYSGNESFIEGSLDEILIDAIVYRKARTLVQADNTLYMGNLEKRPDIGYQKYANNIRVEAVTTGANIGEYKEPEIAATLKGFQRDAIYAFYIAFVLTDGTLTRAYHIPGRIAVGTETDPVSDPDQVAVDDTAKEFHFDGTPDATFNMAYWENENEQYPDSGEDWEVWEVDINGDGAQKSTGETTLHGKQVRHHHFPDWNNEPVNDGGVAINVLSLRLQNVKLPNDIAPDVAAVRVFYAKRDNRNNTVLDQSMTVPAFIQSSLIENNLPDKDAVFSDSTDLVTMAPFRRMRTRESIGAATHLKTIGRIAGSSVENVSLEKYLMNLSAGDITEEIIIRGLQAKAFAEEHIDKVELTNKGFTADGTTFKGESKIFLELISNLQIDLDTSTTGFWEFLTNLCSLKKDVYNSFDAQQLIDTGYIDNTIERYDPTQSYTPEGGSSGDGGTASFAVTEVVNTPNTSTGFVIRFPIEDIGELTVHETAVNVNGTETISEVMTKIVNAVNNDSGANMTAEGDTPTLNQITFTNKKTGSVYNSSQVEADDDSTVGNSKTWDDWTGTPFTPNPTSMNGGEDSTGGEPDAEEFETLNIYGGDTYINEYGVRVTQDDGGTERKVILNFICESQDNIGFRHEGGDFGESYYPKSSSTDVLNLEDDDSISNDEVWYDNPYLYNQDYSELQEMKVSLPYEKVFSQITKHPTRIIRSQQDDPSVREDNFRTFLPADFLDLSRERGELVRLETVGNILIPHLERAIVRTKGREELVVGDVRAFLGAGDIFSVPPDEILMTESGTGGIQSQHAAVKTEFGYFFIDQQEQSVYQLTDQLTDISSNEYGMNNYFNDHLKWNLRQYAKDFDPYAIDKRIFGINMGYDKTYKRVFLVKRDVSPTSTFTSGIDGGTILFNSTTNQFEDGGTPISYSDDTYFTEDNIALSFSTQIGKWISFHSFTPQYLFAGLNNLYAIGRTNYSVFDQFFYTYNDESKPLDVGSTTFPFVFKFVENSEPQKTKVFSNIQFITEAEKQDGTFDRTKTFDKFRVTNRLQDSDEQGIVYFTGAGGNARNVEGTWKINKFRDLVDPDTGSIDSGLVWNKQKRFISKFLRVELKYSNSEDYFLSLFDSWAGGRISNR